MQRSQIAAAHRGKVRELASGRGGSDRPVQQENSAGADAQCLGDVVVGQKDNSTGGRMVAQKVAEALGGSRIHSGERFVAHKYLRSASECARQLQPSTLARGQLSGANIQSTG